MFKKIILKALRVQQRKGEREGTKKESQGEGICLISLRSFKILLPLKKHMPKHAYIKYHSFPQNPSHLTILEGNAQAKLLGLEFQIPQVLCKSTKSVRIEARILVVDSFL